MNERLEVIREMFPKCYYCAGSLRAANLRDLVKVESRDRLAHRDCLAAEAEESDAA